MRCDIMNTLWDTCEDIVNNAKDMDDFAGFKLNLISVLGLDFTMDEEEFKSVSSNEATNKLYQEVTKHYSEKNAGTASKAMPILMDIHKTRGATIENVMVPFTDGKKQIGVAVNLEKCISSEGKELTHAMEKFITLAIIDQLWKEHLREMDDLKQSVQNAVYEQKDPLLIYKFEAFELFKRFVAKMNEENASFLMKAEIPVQQSEEVQEARVQRRQRVNEHKDESRSLLSGGGGSPQANRPPVKKSAPIKSQKNVGRNERVNVQYADGRVVKGVKFKTVEDDIMNNKCVMIDD